MVPLRRIVDHPSTRVVLLILAGAQAMIGAFVLGLAVNIGTSAVGKQPGLPAFVREAPMPPGPFPLATTPVAGIDATPGSITLTADGNLWFTRPDSAGPLIGRVDGAGAIRRFPVPSRVGPGGIAAGPDGAIWFTGGDGEGIGRLAPNGAFSWHPIGSRDVPIGITAGPDGNLWFTVHAYANGEGSWIGRMTPTGTVTRFPLPAARRAPGPILAGPDGNLWFAMADGLGRMTVAGELTEVQLATPFAPTITAGPDGAIWFAANSITEGAMVGRVETGRAPRVTAVFTLPNRANVRGIVAGSDGNLWVAESSLQSIARITPGGQVTQYTLAPDRYPELMVAGKDGAIWFTVLSPRLVGGVERFQIPA